MHTSVSNFPIIVITRSNNPIPTLPTPLSIILITEVANTTYNFPPPFQLYPFLRIYLSIYLSIQTLKPPNPPHLSPPLP